MTFTEKKITCQFSLASGQFQGGGNSVVVSGLRTQVQLSIVGGPPSFGSLALAIYGLPLSDMNALSVVGKQFSASYNNGLDILAGDDDSGMSLIFSGTIFRSWVDAAQMPDVCFRATAMPIAFGAVPSAQFTSINGPGDVSQMIERLSSQIGVKGFENHGVSVKLASPYYSGSAWSQIQQIAEAANIDMAVDRGVLVITPRGKSRAGDVPIISPTTGLVSYPTFVQNGLVVKTLFNPAITLLGNINVQSSLQPACGPWKVTSIDYDLESVTPGGNWFQELNCIPTDSQ